MHELFEIDTNNKGTTMHVTPKLKKGQVHKGYCAVFFRIELLIGGMRAGSECDGCTSINAFKQTSEGQE